MYTRWASFFSNFNLFTNKSSHGRKFVHEKSTFFCKFSFKYSIVTYSYFYTPHGSDTPTSPGAILLHSSFLGFIKTCMNNTVRKTNISLTISLVELKLRYCDNAKKIWKNLPLFWHWLSKQVGFFSNLWLFQKNSENLDWKMFYIDSWNNLWWMNI